MNTKSKNLQLQYQGCLRTPLLWENHTVMGLTQLELLKPITNNFNENLPTNIVLGKRVERFVFAEFRQHKNIDILINNTQIQNKKITVGEIDCILKMGPTPIHVEIVYKFYLFDPHIGSTEIDCWIGPNRKDTLSNKLKKLKEKQLPLIYNINAKPLLDAVDLKAENILSRVYFKAQLFIPYKADKVNFERLNKNCLKGFYIQFSQLNQFSACTFYMPVRMDWLTEIQAQVSWLNYRSFYEQIEPIIHKCKSPLCWIKFPNGLLQKFFVVWWP